MENEIQKHCDGVQKMQRKIASDPPPLIKVTVNNPELYGKSILDPMTSRVTSIE